MTGLETVLGREGTVTEPRRYDYRGAQIGEVTEKENFLSRYKSEEVYNPSLVSGDLYTYPLFPRQNNLLLIRCRTYNYFDINRGRESRTHRRPGPRPRLTTSVNY